MSDFGKFLNAFANKVHACFDGPEYWMNAICLEKIMKYCILYEVCMIKTAPRSTLSPQMWCIKKNKRLVCTHPDLLARICKLVDRKNSAWFVFRALSTVIKSHYCFLNLTVHLFGCTCKAISTRYKICFTPKSLNFSIGASLLAVAKSIY